jgi:hypothetical protein
MYGMQQWFFKGFIQRPSQHVDVTAKAVTASRMSPPNEIFEFGPFDYIRASAHEGFQQFPSSWSRALNITNHPFRVPAYSMRKRKP